MTKKNKNKSNLDTTTNLQIIISKLKQSSSFYKEVKCIQKKCKVDPNILSSVSEFKDPIWQEALKNKLIALIHAKSKNHALIKSILVLIKVFAKYKPEYLAWNDYADYKQFIAIAVRSGDYEFYNNTKKIIIDNNFEYIIKTEPYLMCCYTEFLKFPTEDNKKIIKDLVKNYPCQSKLYLEGQNFENIISKSTNGILLQVYFEANEYSDDQKVIFLSNHNKKFNVNLFMQALENNDKELIKLCCDYLPTDILSNKNKINQNQLSVLIKDFAKYLSNKNENFYYDIYVNLNFINIILKHAPYLLFENDNNGQNAFVFLSYYYTRNVWSPVLKSKFIISHNLASMCTNALSNIFYRKGRDEFEYVFRYLLENVNEWENLEKIFKTKAPDINIFERLYLADQNNIEKVKVILNEYSSLTKTDTELPLSELIDPLLNFEFNNISKSGSNLLPLYEHTNNITNRKTNTESGPESASSRTSSKL